MYTLTNRTWNPQKKWKAWFSSFSPHSPTPTDHPNPFFVLFVSFNRKITKTTTSRYSRMTNSGSGNSKTSKSMPTAWPSNLEDSESFFGNGWLKPDGLVKDEKTWDMLGAFGESPRKNHLYLVPESRIIQDLLGTKSIYFLVCTSLSTCFWGVEWFDVF